MKKYTLLFLFLIIFSVPNFSFDPIVMSNDNETGNINQPSSAFLIVYWNFEGSASANEIGTSNTGETELTLTQSGSIAGSADDSGFMCRALDGSNDYFSPSKKYISGLDQWTIYLHVKTGATVTAGDAVLSQQVGSTGATEAGVYITCITENYIRAIMTNTAGTLVNVAPAFVLSADTWYYVAVIKNGSNYYIGISTSPITSYNDLTNKDTDILTGDLTPYKVFFLGARNNAGTADSFYDLKFDFLKIYNSDVFGAGS